MEIIKFNHFLFKFCSLPLTAVLQMFFALWSTSRIFEKRSWYWSLL